MMYLLRLNPLLGFALLGFCAGRSSRGETGIRTDRRERGPGPEEILARNASFNSTVRDFVSRGRQILYIFTYRPSETPATEVTAVRVSVESKDAQPNFPVLFVIRQQESVLSWSVPIFIEYRFEYKRVSRTLCPLNGKNHTKMNQEIIMEVSTMAQTATNFSLEALLIANFTLELDEVKNLTVTPSEPKYYMFSYPKGVESVMITASSEDQRCLTLSIQDIRCPLYDLDHNIKFHGLFQTMSKTAAIVVEKERYSQGAFYLVMVLMPNNLECSGYDEVFQPGQIRSKRLTIIVQKTIAASQYYQAIIAAISCFLLFYIIAGVISLVYHLSNKSRGILDLSEAERAMLLMYVKYQRKNSQPIRGVTLTSLLGALSDKPAYHDEDEVMITSPGQPRGYGSTDSRELPSVGNTSSAQSDSDVMSNCTLETEDIDFLHDAEEEKDVFRTKTALFVSDLSRKGRKKLGKYGKVYNWNLWTIAIFYVLPVVQLVITYQKVLHLTGNEDTCYYNFKCTRPLGVLSSFNSVFSNIGYVMLGFLFLILVWRRDILHKKTVQQYSMLEKHYGIPQPYGLFYAMGLGLCMEGIMSGCYHVCPTYSNFQFDTSFMYIIACLCMLRLYQTRHPDINAKAHTAYLAMACIIFIAVIGVVYGTPIFWVVFAVLHFMATLLLSLQIYYMGRWKLDLGIFNRIWLLLRSDFLQCARPMYKDRLILLVIGNIINWSFAVYGAFSKPPDFASYLLAIFIGNLLFYLTFYIIMKLRSGERILRFTLIYIVMAAVLWAFSLYFFMTHLTSWQLSPAQSRDQNRDCVLLDFYDTHDIWHFLSAMSMFFSFMILLTLDDDLYVTRRDRIPVF